MQDKNSGRCCLNVKLCLVVSLPGVKRGWLCPFCASFFVSSHRLRVISRYRQAFNNIRL